MLPAPNPDPDANGLTLTFNQRFPGQTAFAESGLNYNYFRDYDPQTGRYVESDPIGLAGRVNTYGYVAASPESLVDPTGTDAVAEMSRLGWGLYPEPEQSERDCARAAFVRNYLAMRRANWKFQDKYFHCEATCDAARCGKHGQDEACKASNERESFDQFFKGTLTQCQQRTRLRIAMGGNRPSGM